MTKNAGDPISRWRERQAGGAAAEDRAAEMVRNAMVPGQPDPQVLLRIEQNLHARAWKRGRFPIALRLVFAAVILVAGVASAKAYELARRAGWFERAHPAPPAETPVRSPAASRVGKAKNPAPAAPAPPAPPAPPSLNTETAEHASDEIPASDPPRPAPTPAAPPSVTSPSRHHALATRRMAAIDPPQFATTTPAVVEQKPPSTPTTPGPSDEIRALDQAMGLLRRDHNATAALPALDSYLRRYPRGILNHEARLARVDALLMLERSQEALAALEELPLDHRRRSAELQVVRGELRARHDCARAEDDFTAALTHSPDAGLLERILYDRGMCRAKLGNRAGAGEDLRRYLERFPSGSHAGQVRRWLETIDKSPAKGG
jgi:hypothetical protein